MPVCSVPEERAVRYCESDGGLGSHNGRGTRVCHDQPATTEAGVVGPGVSPSRTSSDLIPRGANRCQSSLTFVDGLFSHTQLRDGLLQPDRSLISGDDLF